MNISAQELLQDLRSGRNIDIKVFNLGENLGMDFAYFGHYMALQEIFPNVKIDLFRSNVDETNCIGLETYQNKANLPVRSMVMATVKQRYGGQSGPDWTHFLNNHNYDIFSNNFRSILGYDYVWGIGYGSAPCWKDQYPEETRFLGSDTVSAAIEMHLRETNAFPNYPVLDLANTKDLRPWDRTLMEYLVYQREDYPFTFNRTFQILDGERYQDYMRVGLRWPDHVRWYWSIERQYEALFDIIGKIRQAGKPVKLIYTLKDGEVGNNFNRGQSLELLRRVQDLCDDCLFTYSWPLAPYIGRISEYQELVNLKQAGIRKIKKVDVWEDLLLSSMAKVYFSDPGGFAEVICMLRKSETTFLMPTSFQHLCTYITLNQNREPINLKIHPVCVSQGYDCCPVLSAPDDPEGYRTLHWNIYFKEQVYKIGDNNHGDDWKYFQLAQDNVFKEMYDLTHHDLVNAIVEQYLK